MPTPTASVTVDHLSPSIFPFDQDVAGVRTARFGEEEIPKTFSKRLDQYFLRVEKEDLLDNECEE